MPSCRYAGCVKHIKQGGRTSACCILSCAGDTGSLLRAAFQTQLFDALNASARGGGAAGQGQEQGLPNRDSSRPRDRLRLLPKLSQTQICHCHRWQCHPAPPGSHSEQSQIWKFKKKTSKGRALNLVLSYPANEGL